MQVSECSRWPHSSRCIISHRYFFRLIDCSLEKLLNIKADVHDEVNRLFYVNKTVLDALGGTNSGIQSNLLGIHIELTLSDFVSNFKLPNVGEHVYFIAFDDLPAYGRTESEVHSASSLTDGKSKTALNLIPIFESFPIGWKCRHSCRLQWLHPPTPESVSFLPSHRLENK